MFKTNISPRTLFQGLYGPVHALSCTMGNQGKMAGNSNVCMGFQSQLILPELVYLTLSL